MSYIRTETIRALIDTNIDDVEEIIDRLDDELTTTLEVEHEITKRSSM